MRNWQATNEPPQIQTHPECKRRIKMEGTKTDWRLSKEEKRKRKEINACVLEWKFK